MADLNIVILGLLALDPTVLCDPYSGLWCGLWCVHRCVWGVALLPTLTMLYRGVLLTTSCRRILESSCRSRSTCRIWTGSSRTCRTGLNSARVAARSLTPLTVRSRRFSAWYSSATMRPCRYCSSSPVSSRTRLRPTCRKQTVQVRIVDHDVNLQICRVMAFLQTAERCFSGHEYCFQSSYRVHVPGFHVHCFWD